LLVFPEQIEEAVDSIRNSNFKKRGECALPEWGRKGERGKEGKTALSLHSVHEAGKRKKENYSPRQDYSY